jgi:hypothetical protein
MSYVSRKHRRPTQDPSCDGIFIHGGTCMRHDSAISMLGNLNPNSFTLTLPLVNGRRIHLDHQALNPRHATFKRALEYAKALRDVIRELHHCPIYACTDVIHSKTYTGRTEVQLVSPRLSKKPPENLQAAAA